MDLACKICCDSYTTSGLHRPRCLPCGHTLCGVCATRLLDNGNILCPVCQRSYKYQDLDKIAINHELEDVIERLISVSLLTESTAAANPNPVTTPQNVPPSTVPCHHYGICEEQHGEPYKVKHHCMTHDGMSMCSGDCALAYHHMERDCLCVPTRKVFYDRRKTDHCMKMEYHMTSLYEKSQQGGVHNNILKDSELQIKTQIQKFQSGIKALTQQMSICKKSGKKYTDIIQDRQEKKAQFSKNNVQSVSTYLELNNESHIIESSEHKTQECAIEVKNTQKQGFGALLTTGTLASLAACQEVYATHTHEDQQQRWGRIVARDGYLLMQDLRSNNPPTGAAVFNLSDVTDAASSPCRHVFLRFSTKAGTDLGMVVIKVNEEAPRRAQQLIDLCVGQTGERYAGTTAIGVGGKGKTSEFLSVESYLTKNNENSNEKLFPDLEKITNIVHKKGLVVIFSEYGADFLILTRSGHSGTWEGPALGEVISGFCVLEKIIGDNLVGWFSSSSHVTISESGLVIDSTYRK